MSYNAVSGKLEVSTDEYQHKHQLEQARLDREQRGATAHADREMEARAKALQLAIEYETVNLRNHDYSTLTEGRVFLMADKFTHYLLTGKKT